MAKKKVNGDDDRGDYRGFPPNQYRRVGVENNPIYRVLGAIALLTLWTTWLGGLLSPFWLLAIVLHGEFTESYMRSR